MKLALFALATAALAAQDPHQKWIAHRGGVVDGRYSENSPASLVAAVKHGYWMIESDIRETRDGKIITQHDPDFMRFYKDSRQAVDMTLAEVLLLRANPGNTAPMTFHELVRACRGRLGLMLDIKEPEHGEAFYDEIEKELRAAGMLESTYFIGLESAWKHFRGKARVAVNTKQLKEAVLKGEDVSKLYFLFEWGKTLTPTMVKFAQSHQVAVVPSINTFHYGSDMAESIRIGSDDVRRMKKLGVTEFQIDSVYEPAFR